MKTHIQGSPIKGSPVSVWTRLALFAAASALPVVCAAGAQQTVARHRTHAHSRRPAARLRGSPAAPQSAAPEPSLPPQIAQADLPPDPGSLVSPLQLPGGVALPREQPSVLPLRLDDAIALALKANTGVLLGNQQERTVRGEILTVENVLLPSLTFKAYTQAQEIDLAAMGFKPSSLAGISIPGVTLGPIAQIVKVNTTSAQISLSQPLFDLPAFFLYRASRHASEAAFENTLSTRGEVVLQVGGLYLRILADQAQLANAQALVRQDQVVFDQARARRDAGVGINLDVLRAQVQLQDEQQNAISAASNIAKDKIALNRAMGQPAGQQLDLLDTVPFAEYTNLPLADALTLAYARRKDLLSLQAQLALAQETGRAVKYQRLPTLGVGGFYGVLGETTGLYHGVFAAEGKLSFPIFEEGTLRGEREVAAAQTLALKRQIDSRRVQIEADIRSNMLDVQSFEELVKVARSNQALAAQELDDATARFHAGVDDSLPVVRAQAALEGAQTQLIQAEFQYNFAKLQLARNTGVVETQYKSYLGR